MKYLKAILTFSLGRVKLLRLAIHISIAHMLNIRKLLQRSTFTIKIIIMIKMNGLSEMKISIYSFICKAVAKVKIIKNYL